MLSSIEDSDEEKEIQPESFGLFVEQASPQEIERGNTPQYERSFNVRFGSVTDAVTAVDGMLQTFSVHQMFRFLGQVSMMVAVSFQQHQTDVIAASLPPSTVGLTPSTAYVDGVRQSASVCNSSIPLTSPISPIHMLSATDLNTSPEYVNITHETDNTADDGEFGITEALIPTMEQPEVPVEPVMTGPSIAAALEAHGHPTIPTVPIPLDLEETTRQVAGFRYELHALRVDYRHMVESVGDSAVVRHSFESRMHSLQLRAINERWREVYIHGIFNGPWMSADFDFTLSRSL